MKSQLVVGIIALTVSACLALVACGEDDERVPLAFPGACSITSDCETGLTCWKQNGPARGTCTKACSTPEDCQGVDPKAECHKDGACVKDCASEKDCPDLLFCTSENSSPPTTCILEQ